MRKTISDNQRFHRQRDVLVPHGGVTGLWLSINPRQVPRALREAHDYFDALTQQLQFLCCTPEANNLHSTTTSEMLAAELKYAVETDHNSRKRKRDKDDDESWFSSVSTGCKGYLLLRIPMMNPEVTCCLVDNVAENEPKNEDRSTRHKILINPLVSYVVEQVFADLEKNPRPIFKNCFRLIPVELTCCPVLQEMIPALKQLINAHFSESCSSEEEFDGKYDKLIPFPKKTTEKTLTTVLLKFSVKNNTNVLKEKNSIEQSLIRSFPLNKFTVLQRENNDVEAAFCIIVAQSTCTMGVQRCYTERQKYNVGEIGRKSFVVDTLLNPAA